MAAPYNGDETAHWIAYEDNAVWKIAQVASAGAKSVRLRDGEKIPRRRVWLDPAPPPSAALDEQVNAVAATLPADALWRAAAGNTLTLPQLAAAAADIGGEGAGANEDIRQLAVLQQVLNHPVYFHRRGSEIISVDAATVQKAQAALAVRQQRHEEEQTLLQQLQAGALPPAIRAAANELLFAPQKSSPPYRALKQHLAGDSTAFARFFLQHGLLRDELHFHELMFATKWQPKAEEEEALDDTATAAPPQLPQATCEAFSIDDGGTKEIDDAFSLHALADGGWRLGIHIAAPALLLGGAADAVARARQISVYFPHEKHFMLPAAAVDACSLSLAAARPALSLYLHINPAKNEWHEESTVLEQVRLSACTTPTDIDDATAPPPLLARAAQLQDAAAVLAPHFANTAAHTGNGNDFKIDAQTMRVSRRARHGIARTVEIFMRCANTLWAGKIAAAGGAGGGGLFRHEGKLLLAAPRAPHAPYMWLTSPLRRYVDLANQRLLLAALMPEMAEISPPMTKEDWHALRRAFSARHTLAQHFQRAMEQHWSLAILRHRAPPVLGGVSLGQRRVRLDDYPLTATLPQPLTAERRGSAVTVRVDEIDLLAQRLFVSEAAAVTS